MNTHPAPPAESTGRLEAPWALELTDDRRDKVPQLQSISYAHAAQNSSLASSCERAESTLAARASLAYGKGFSGGTWHRHSSASWVHRGQWDPDVLQRRPYSLDQSHPVDSPVCPVTVSGTRGPAAAVGKGGSHVSCGRGRARGGLGAVEKAAGLPAGWAAFESGSALPEGTLSWQARRAAFGQRHATPGPAQATGPSL